MEKNIPPLINPFMLPYVSSQMSDKKEPHILFMPHDLSRRMRIELDKRNMSFEDFVSQACKEYIKIIDDEYSGAVQSNSTAQSTNSETFVSVDLNSNSLDINNGSEDKELAAHLENLQKLSAAFKKPKKDSDHEPLIKSKKRHSKDNRHFEKK